MTYKRIILTIREAADLQKLQRQARANDEPFDYPSPYRELLEVPLPREANVVADEERVAAGYGMLLRGASAEQVAMQLMWKPNSQILRQLVAMARLIPKTKSADH
ncbi:hypothetical protein [Sphingomonas sp. Leaf257]|jgi:hypothetical protein|uniref:hypothetical protein n=1 Tax=Sphingomonas sp. Leaf257 TaxID=1736309 RepID=UPI0012E14949|nr:hypothetical protein [Sphingomonas sp. Leaf257]